MKGQIPDTYQANHRQSDREKANQSDDIRNSIILQFNFEKKLHKFISSQVLIIKKLILRNDKT